MTALHMVLRPLLCVLLLALPALARANMAAPSQPGDAVGEPAPSLTSMHILHEDLSIDLSQVGRYPHHAQITARYQIRNTGPAQRVELFFAAPGLQTGSVQHQGQTLPARRDERALSMLGLVQAESRGEANASGLRFDVDLVPGEQTIEVRYAAKAAYERLEDVRSYAVSYLFGPARRWASFGTLQVELSLPPDWELVQPPLSSAEVAGGSSANLRWQLSQLPADEVRFHVAPRLAPYRRLEVAQDALNGLALVVPVMAALRLRRREERAASPLPGRERLISLLLSALLVALLPLLPEWARAAWYPYGAPSYGRAFAIAGVWFLAGLVTVGVHALIGREIKPRKKAGAGAA